MSHRFALVRRAASPRTSASLLRRWRGVGVAALAVVFGATMAAGFVALDLGQRLAATEEAAVGRVAAIDVEVRDGEPWTLVTLDVERWWRRDGDDVAGVGGVGDATGVGNAAGDGDAGDVGDATSTAAFWGGQAPGVEPLQVAGMPAFALGERVMWWLRSADAGLAAPTVGVTQGVWRDVEGEWIGDDGVVLGVDEGGDLALDGRSVPDAVLFDAIAAAFETMGGTP